MYDNPAESMEARGKVGPSPAAGGESTPAASAARSSEDFPYQGEPGRTRLEHLHVPLPGGLVRSVQVYRVVNVATDPHLREPALAGGLHRFESGEELAVPFVYHDPEARKMALVVPDVLRHEAFAERARLLQRIADDREHPVPPYVRDHETVIGVQELAAFLERPSGVAIGARAQELTEREQALEQRERALEQRERELDDRESKAREREQALDARETEAEETRGELHDRELRMRQRAEGITSREDDLRTLGEQIDARQRELEIRERELENRMEAVQERERQVAERGTDEHEAPGGSDGLAEDDVEEVKDVGELEELPTGHTSPQMELADGDLADAVELVAEDEAEPVDDEAVEELVDDDEVEEVDDLELVAEDTSAGERRTGTSTQETELDESKTTVRSLEELEAEAQAGPEETTGTASSPPTPVSPPPEFLEDRLQQMAATLGDEGVWLFARLEEGREKAFRGPDGSAADLLVQLADVQGYPIILLALVETADGRPYVRRAALDPHREAHRDLLVALRRRFEASVALFGPGGSYERTIEVSAPRGINVDLILQRVTRSTKEPEIDAATALARALEVPPPIRATHPFSEDPQPAADAAAAKKAVDRLAEWASPDKLDRALLGLSVPRDVVDETFRCVLEDAVQHGIALDPTLAGRAVSIGVAAEPGELVTQQIEAFRATVAREDRGGLDPERVADNWEALLEAAAEHEIAIDQQTHEAAWRDIRAVKGESSMPEPLGEVDPGKLGEMGPSELIMLLQHPNVRVEAALELCRRGDGELLEPLYKGVRKMPREEVARVVPRVVRMGEVAGDVLIDGLTARKTFVRQASAVGLGELKLRRSIVPLVHLLQNEPSDVWREVARVLGELGSAAFRTVARQLKDPKGQEERLAYTLACLAEHGCAEQVDELRREDDPAVTQVAEQAMTMGDVVKAHTRETREAEGPPPEDPIRAFSRRLYEELDAAEGSSR